MMYSIQSKSRANRRKVLSAALTAAFSICILSRSVLAQQEPLSPPTAVNAPQWVIGPGHRQSWKCRGNGRP